MMWFAVVLFLKIATERADDIRSGTISSISNDMPIAFHAPSLTFFVVSMLLLELPLVLPFVKAAKAAWR